MDLVNNKMLGDTLEVLYMSICLFELLVLAAA